MSGSQQTQDRQSSGSLIPEDMIPIPWDVFTGVNTNSSRVGIKDEQLSICDGFFPVGDSWLRTLYGIGTSIFTANTQSHGSVVMYGFLNTGATPYCMAITSDGSIYAINTSTRVSVLVGENAILNPSVSNVGISQFNGTNPVGMIVANQPDGYLLFDGSLLYNAGTVSPIIDITDGGSGYSANPSITVASGSGSGATFYATVIGGVITAIVPTNPGTGYVATDTQLQNLTVTDATGTGATATIELMPFGVQGTCITAYSGRVWIGNGVNLIFSAPESPVDFSTTDGGGVTPSNDSTLRVSYIGLVSTNGFLYLVGDSNVSYISGVSTTTSDDTTTTSFSLQNADPQTGTPYAGTVTLLGQDVLFANSFGVHASYGGRVTKVSDELDGIYTTVPNFGGLQLSAGVGTIFGKRVWMVLVQVLDQVSQQPVNKLMMWDRKKWFTSQQDVGMIFIAAQEINSVLTTFATDGNVIVPLFQVPSTGFTKVAQSKLFARPHYMLTKTASRIWGLFQYYSPNSPDLTISVDSEFGPSSIVQSDVFNVMTWTNNTGGTISWTNNADEPIVWFSSVGVGVLPPTAVAQQGTLLGLTVSTEAADMAILSMAIGAEAMQYRG
jgi:hypothetical protein